MTNLLLPAGDLPIVTPPAGDPPVAPPALTVVELQAQLAEKDRALKNKTEEASRHFKKIETLEAAEETRKKAQMSALELAQKDAADARAAVEQAKADATKARAEAEESLLQAALTTRAVALGMDEGEVPTAWLTLRNDAALRAKITAKAGAAPGTFEGVDEVIKQMLKDHPRWAKAPTTKHDINGSDRGIAGAPSQAELIDRKRSQYAGTF